MKQFWKRVHDFFFPPAGSPTWVRALPYIVLGVLTLILFFPVAYVWDYTNSPAFCGTSCHTMPPEYTSYLTSPHARIDCVDCHIGKGFIATRLTRKAGDLKHVFATISKNYEFPIRAGELRPARETCELCHFPDKFSDDSLRQLQRFSNDKENSPYTIYLTLKTGGGSERQGLGRGIHWHIQSKIFYYSEDITEQIIPYVKVVNPDGSSDEYLDIESEFNPASLDPAELKEMDCATCHNRITHLVPAPEDTIDQLMTRNQISPSIPEIHKKALEVYSQIFDTTEKGLKNIEGLDSYYRQTYPDFYAANSQLITEAITALKTAYAASVFPEQNSDWNSHSNNVGHKDSPGCFRCHDGKHLDAEKNAVRLECNLCHSVPVVAGPFDFVARIEISRGPEPEAHKSPNWISMHNRVMDETCVNCHTTDDPGGTSNTSFCSNSACHGSTWTYAGFDAPKLREIIQSQLPPTPTPAPLPSGAALTYKDSVGPLLESRCGSCHGSSGIKGLDLTSYQGLMKGSESGPVILPGDPTNSLLVQKQSGAQPHFGQFTSEELQLILDWIMAGAPE